ncbi:MAG: hypothetical protein KDC05_13575 [Bacteroidales bacterium]|nr:hypothetical protein [Bacteroidales bacterium]
MTYDFTTDSSQFYGGSSACVQIDESRWAIPAGDATKNGIIETTDKEIWSNEAGKQGYSPSDFNLDGQVDNCDLNDIWLKNLGLGGWIPE